MPNAMSDGPSPVRLSPASSLKRRASPSSSHSSGPSHQSPPLSPEIGYNAAHQYSTNPPASGGTASVRRREANRLAAQRFRSRKKGYQDSLEERIRVLESEKEVLIRQVDESLSRTGHPSTSLQPRSSDLRHAQADGNGVDGAHWPGKRNSNPTHRSTSPERRETPLDADVRIASLESANRRLQDDVRNLIEENEQLRDEMVIILVNPIGRIWWMAILMIVLIAAIWWMEIIFLL
ncbi:hypothetical protein L486_05880 [Kwoniella mangroviensis CBS 10435]|uniref:BZIP domain-containing protein n=1 Tax=Kwoniella mangroviensis CBS 10435 TaxID=1331196 RepID=A0A1B9IN89_9TREE|nr:hypothetical protein L486_05880 [Kwoniella mangroviensis CBS 10435]